MQLRRENSGFSPTNEINRSYQLQTFWRIKNFKIPAGRSFGTQNETSKTKKKLSPWCRVKQERSPGSSQTSNEENWKLEKNHLISHFSSSPFPEGNKKKWIKGVIYVSSWRLKVFFLRSSHRKVGNKNKQKVTSHFERRKGIKITMFNIFRPFWTARLEQGHFIFLFLREVLEVKIYILIMWNFSLFLFPPS